jgi:hypothetical protein
MRSPMSVRSMNAQSINDTTPKANRASSIRRPPSTIGTAGKRGGTVAHEYMRRHDRHEPPVPVHGGHRFMGAYKREFSGSNGRPDEFDLVSRDDGDDPDASYEGLENVRGKFHFSHQEQLLTNSML